MSSALFGRLRRDRCGLAPVNQVGTGREESAFPFASRFALDALRLASSDLPLQPGKSAGGRNIFHHRAGNEKNIEK